MEDGGSTAYLGITGTCTAASLSPPRWSAQNLYGGPSVAAQRKENPTMKVLFIGGTGIISTASTRLAVERGIDLYLLNRGNRELPPGTTSLIADIRDQEATARVLADHTFDAVVNWIAFTPEDIERDIALFRGKTSQYIFI